jgi:GH25 family lysozyme M1 (1,4-beta-N-acetylmuramidase)
VNAVAGNARGIDVSNFAGEFNWDGTSGLTFGICRASQGLGAAGTNSPDPFLTWNWPRIKARGLARGAYHFLDPRLDGAAQASYSFFSFITAGNCAGLRSYPLWLAIFQSAAPSAPAPWSA